MRRNPPWSARLYEAATPREIGAAGVGVCVRFGLGTRGVLVGVFVGVFVGVSVTVRVGVVVEMAVAAAVAVEVAVAVAGGWVAVAVAAG
jgi:hypothetical protein